MNCLGGRGYIALGLLVLASGCNKSSSNPVDAAVPDFYSTIGCEKNSDCPNTLPECHPMAKVCVGCISTMFTCTQNGYVCDDKTHSCVPRDPTARCRFNADCDVPSAFCDNRDGGSGKCVQCISSLDCPDPDKPFCDNRIEGDAGAPLVCKDNCARCRGDFPVCARDAGLCCPVDGGACFEFP